MELFRGAVAELIRLSGKQYDYTRVVFPEGWKFREKGFPKDALFNGATFTGGAHFNGATFAQRADFAGATFKDVAHFADVTFTGGAHFNGATFMDQAAFSGARFEKAALFENATFEDEAQFSGAKFTENAIFSGTRFEKGADFRNAAAVREFRLVSEECPRLRITGLQIDYVAMISVPGKLLLEVADLRGSGRLTLRDVGDKLHEEPPSVMDFTGLRFDGSMYLDNVDLRAATFQKADLSCLRLLGVYWAKQEAREIVLRDEIELEDAEPDKLDARIEEIERQYRGFKESYKARENHWMAGWANFGELEMRLRRKLDEHSEPSALPNFLRSPWMKLKRLTVWEWWYRKSSRFGMSFWRPVILAVITYGAFFLLGVVLLAVYQVPDLGGNTGRYFEYHTRGMFYLKSQLKIHYADCLRTPLEIISTLGKVSVGVLLAMAVVAIRRRFKA